MKEESCDDPEGLLEIERGLMKVNSEEKKKDPKTIPKKIEKIEILKEDQKNLERIPFQGCLRSLEEKLEETNKKIEMIINQNNLKFNSIQQLMLRQQQMLLSQQEQLLKMTNLILMQQDNGLEKKRENQGEMESDTENGIKHKKQKMIENQNGSINPQRIINAMKISDFAFISQRIVDNNKFMNPNILRQNHILFSEKFSSSSTPNHPHKQIIQKKKLKNPEESINLAILGQDGDKLDLRVKIKTKIQKIAEVYCKCKDLHQVFCFLRSIKGVDLNQDSTVEETGLQNGDSLYLIFQD